MNPIEYLKSKGFRVTSDPTQYDSDEWGLRNYTDYGINYDSYCDGYHRAYDLSDKDGREIPSVCDGTVVSGTGDKGNFGGTVVIVDADNEYQYIYGHLQRPVPVKVGDIVRQGDIIGKQGATNYDEVYMDSHLHFQVQKAGYIPDEKTFVCSGINPLNIDVSKYEGVDKVGKKIVVDIGHDPSAFPPSKGVYKNGKGYAEYDFNKKLGTRIISLLKSNGFDVITNDVNASLSQRTNYYDSKRPDLGISVHANAGASNVGGRCAFYWTTSAQGKKFATNIINNMKDKGYGIHGNGLHASEYNSWTNLHMVRECTTFPMVLVEHGFMTNALDFPLIFGDKQDEYIEDMAECNVRAVCEYFGVSFKSNGTKPAPAPTPTGVNLYRVQVGAFSKASNARTLEAEVKKKGYSTYLAYDTDDNLYRVQVGAYSQKSNAEKQLDKLKASGYKDAFIADNDGHVVSDGDADANETVAPKENQTPRLIGDWKTNDYGTQYIQAEGTFTVGGSRIMSRFGSPFMSASEGGWANPGWSCDYFEMTRSRESATEGYISVAYKSGGKLKYIPIRTWNPTTGAVGELWGTLT